MKRLPAHLRMTGLVLVTALASTALAGCTAKGAPRADLSAGKAEAALAKGQSTKAIDLAETAVAADPHNAEYRTVLGNAYLAQGRFISAVGAYEDAMRLDNKNARTALGLALAYIGAGSPGLGANTLDDWRDDIEAADLGLAYALAGQADRGVMILTDTLRQGENTAKVRQNLAYAYALAGQWRDARLMAAQDIPADQIDDRIGAWAQLSYPEAIRERVAMVLDVPANTPDTGQPARLALVNTPDVPQLASEAVAQNNNTLQDEELPALAQDTTSGYKNGQDAQDDAILAHHIAPVDSGSASFEAAFASHAIHGPAPATVMAGAVRFISSPVVQQLPMGLSEQNMAVATPQPATKAGTHRVQLGSFTSKNNAQRAWNVYTKRHPGLRGHDLQLTRARVNGQEYWRVAAAGFNRGEALSTCQRIRRASKDGCIAYSVKSPLPGVIS